MRIRTIAVVAAMAFAATMALAQDFPPDMGGGPGGPPDMGPGQDMGMPGPEGMGPGQGRMGPPMGMMGPGGMNGLMDPLMLLQRRDVQEDLKLTDEQKTKVQDLSRTMRTQRRRIQLDGDGAGGPPDMGGGPGGPPPDMGGAMGGDPAEMEKRMAERQKQVKAEVAKILTDGQQTRLKEIAVQLAGNMAVLDEDVQKDLGVTTEQKASIKSLRKKQGEAGRSIMEKVRNGEIEPAQMFTLMQKNSKAMDTELAKLLSVTQKEKLKTMAGTPFKADAQERRGGGPRGPGGGPGFGG